jgi:hypothetical protein
VASATKFPCGPKGKLVLHLSQNSGLQLLFLGETKKRIGEQEPHYNLKLLEWPKHLNFHMYIDEEANHIFRSKTGLISSKLEVESQL